MRTILPPVLLACMFTSVALCDEADFQWQGDLQPGQLLEIRGIFGGIRAEGTLDTTPTITAHKTAGMSDPASVSIRVVPFDGGVVVCAMYPDADSPRPNTCNPPGMDTYLSARNSDVQVEFTIKVPPGVRLTGSTLRGAIQATALTGEVNVSTNDGAISLSTTEGAQATTLRGSISATVGNVAWSGFRVFETLDGDVDLQIPIDANVSVRAATLRGSVTSDFPLTTRSGPFGGPTIASGTLGNDGRSLRLSTENGNIILRQGAATNH